jgi:hypothetical protein
MTGTGIAAAPIAVADADLDDLRDRLARTRWPEQEPVSGWAQGAPSSSVRALCDYWHGRYDWRRCERMLNGWNPQRTDIDGVAVHFFQVRSPEPGACRWS